MVSPTARWGLTMRRASQNPSGTVSGDGRRREPSRVQPTGVVLQDSGGHQRCDRRHREPELERAVEPAQDHPGGCQRGGRPPGGGRQRPHDCPGGPPSGEPPAQRLVGCRATVPTMGYVETMRALVGSRPLLLVAAGVVVQAPDGRVLLQRRTDDSLWGLPGGALEPGESLEDAARRELLEETGLVARELPLLDVYSGADFFLEYPNGDQAYVVGATFLVRDVAEALTQPDPRETSELGYFPLSGLPEGMSGYNHRLLDRCRAALTEIVSE